MKVAVIADTHGAISERVLDLLRTERVDLILHAGDYANEAYLYPLETIAPLEVVRGNNDFDSPHPLTRTLNLDGVSVHMAHLPRDLERLLRDTTPNEPILGIHGHTHVPCFEQTDDLTIANPGSTRRPRGGGGPSMLILELAGGRITHRFVEV